jgi:hypothetical protein
MQYKVEGMKPTFQHLAAVDEDNPDGQPISFISPLVVERVGAIN